MEAFARLLLFGELFCGGPGCLDRSRCKNICLEEFDSWNKLNFFILYLIEFVIACSIGQSTVIAALSMSALMVGMMFMVAFTAKAINGPGPGGE